VTRRSTASKRADRRSGAKRIPAQRIQKVLAEAGLGSRREIEAWIAAGRVAVDGRRAELGDRIDGTERIVVNGRPVRLKRRATAHAHIAYHKPAGEVTTRQDPEGRPTIFERLPPAPRGRWINVGRLDLSTSGLLLLTTDGELAHRLMHPRYEITREYAVRLLGAPTASQLETLLRGVQLDDGPARFDTLDVRGGSGRNSWLHVTLREGRNREVRRMFQALGLPVSRLIRVRYGPVQLGRMLRGRSRALTDGEVAALYAAVELEPPGDERERPRQRTPVRTHRSARSGDVPAGGKGAGGKTQRGKTQGGKTQGSKSSAHRRGGKRDGDKGSERGARRSSARPRSG